MFFKVLGGILIIFSTSAFGLYILQSDKLRIDDLEEMKKALTVLKSEISFSSVPLFEAMLNISLRTTGIVSNIFLNASEKYMNRNGENAFEIWESSIKSNLSKAHFALDDIEAFLSFGRTVGYSDKAHQLANADIAISYIEEKQKYLKEKLNKNSKMYKSMGFLTGALITVILL